MATFDVDLTLGAALEGRRRTMPRPTVAVEIGSVNLNTDNRAFWPPSRVRNFELKI